jgi:hypothetical protein
MINNHYNYFLIDLRDPEKYKSYHLPLAVNIPLDSMLNREWEVYFKQSIRTNIFYADDTLQAKKACKLSELLGKANGLVLNTTPEIFRTKFYEAVHPQAGASKDEMNLYYFRLKSSKAMDDLVKSLERFNSQPKVKRVLRAQGGCN